MDHFEKLFSNGIPQAEAASFFINVRRPADYLVEEYSKIASARVHEIAAEMLAGKMPEGKAGYFKSAASVIAREKTAASGDEFTPEAVANLKAVGRGRAITGLSAEAHREAGRRGERAGSVVGSLAGAAGGAAAGHKYLPGAVGTLGGAAMGAMLGNRAGKEVGIERDIRKNASTSLQGIYGNDVDSALKVRDSLMAQHGNPEDIAAHNAFISSQTHKHKTAMVRAFRKMAFGAAGGGTGQGEGLAASQPDQSATVQPEGSPAPTPPAPAPAAPSMTQLPVNYMGAEAAGERAQVANEAAYYRARMAEAVAESAGLQQSLQQSQQQMQEAQQQAQEAHQQIEMSAQESVAAGERALQNKLEVVNVTIGAQKMREQIAQLVAQDPAQINQQEQAAQQAAEEQQAMAQQGMPGAPGESPDPGSAPGSVPAENNQGGGTNAPADTEGGPNAAEPQSALKTSSVHERFKLAAAMQKKKTAGLLRNIKRFPETLSGKRGVRAEDAAHRTTMSSIDSLLRTTNLNDEAAKLKKLHADAYHASIMAKPQNREGYVKDFNDISDRRKSVHDSMRRERMLVLKQDKASNRMRAIADKERSATKRARIGTVAVPAVGGGAYAATRKKPDEAKTAGVMSEIGSDMLMRAPYFAGGAAIGAGSSYLKARGADAAQEHVREVQGQPTSFSQALDLASAKSMADSAAIHRDYPGRSMARSALAGGLSAAALGPSAVGSGRRIISAAKDYMTARRS